MNVYTNLYSYEFLWDEKVRAKQKFISRARYHDQYHISYVLNIHLRTHKYLLTI